MDQDKIIIDAEIHNIDGILYAMIPLDKLIEIGIELQSAIPIGETN